MSLASIIHWCHLASQFAVAIFAVFHETAVPYLLQLLRSISFRFENVRGDGFSKKESQYGIRSRRLINQEKPEVTDNRKEWNITASQNAKKTVNPIRKIVDQSKPTCNPNKTAIKLSIGDPTFYGNMRPPVEANQAMLEAFLQTTAHCYPPAWGNEEARKAVAKLCSRDGYTVKSDDIILTSGCSHALEMCINSIADAGDNILIPQPGFSLYTTLCHSLNIETRFYQLKPDEDWEIDLDSLKAVVDSRTKAVIINNPSNPCGAVYHGEHLQRILDVCEQYRLPIIADEVYADMVFVGNEFHYLGVMSKQVPILSCGGMGKRYICPGWRLGWITIHDRNDLFKESIKPGLFDLSTRILGPHSVTQSALPGILLNTPQTFFDETMSHIQNNAKIGCQILARAPGLKPLMPKGAMYMMVGMDSSVYDHLKDDVAFFKALADEQSVMCLPASVFGISNFIRLVLTVPTEKMREACERIVEFCNKHKTKAISHALCIPKNGTLMDLGDMCLLNEEN